MLKRLLRSAALQRAASKLLKSYLTFALRSTRWTVEGAAHLTPFLAGGPVVVAVWHERLPLMLAVWHMARRANPQRRAAVLASRHRDGRLIGAVFARAGLQIVHGSSGRARPAAAASGIGIRGPAMRDHGGAAGLRGLLAALADGHAVVLTPDGPRGPRRIPAPGVAQLAALSAAPVLPAAAQVRRRITLDSWDRLVLPLPFGRGAVVCLPPLSVLPDGAADALPIIAAALTDAADRADALCR